MPCTAKKDEALRPTVRGDIDAVLTTRELARMIRARRIPFASLPNEARFDSPLGESTGAAQIFGASGGVLEAALRTAAHMAGLRDAPLEFKGVRGVAEGVKTAVVPGVGEVAAVSGIRAAQRLLADDEWRRRFVMIEVMACVGGCLGGGGEVGWLLVRAYSRVRSLPDTRARAAQVGRQGHS
jgi:NADH-quinone oxidoreductase subunit G